MNVTFRIGDALIKAIRLDLHRPHRFAHERVGFIEAGAAAGAQGSLVILAKSYRPVEDDDYINDPSVGALMGPGAIRSAMQHAYHAKCSVFHVHMHEHSGPPWFSRYDLQENAKFVPDFFNVSAQMPHGALVLSHDGAAGICWRAKAARPAIISEIVEVGAPLRIHRKPL